MQRVRNGTGPLQYKTAGKAPPGALVHQLAVEVGNRKVSLMIQDSTQMIRTTCTPWKTIDRLAGHERKDFVGDTGRHVLWVSGR